MEKYGVVPPRFSKKWWTDYFWMYYKWRVFWIALAVIIAAVTLFQCATREKYDITVTYAGNMEFSDNNTEKFTAALSGVIDDINGDGKNNVFFQQIRFRDTSASAEMDYAAQTKLDAELQSGDTYVYLISKKQANTWLNRDTGGVDVFAPVEDWADLSEISADRLINRRGKAYAVKVSDSAVIRDSDIVHEDLYIMMRPLYDVYENDEKKAAQYNESKKAAALLLEE